MEKIPMTEEGQKKLLDELKHLKTVERPIIIKAIADARSNGDLSENAEYHAAREKQSFIEGRVAEIESTIAQAEIIDVSKLSGTVVKFGATVSIINLDDNKESKYQLVGEVEADIEQKKNFCHQSYCTSFNWQEKRRLHRGFYTQRCNFL